MRNSLGIKNLSIALEALSRINTLDSHGLFLRVKDLLEDQLKEEETLIRTPPPLTPPDDEISF